MVTKTLPRNQLFSWSTNFDVDVNGNVVAVWFHNGSDSYKIQLDAATVAMAKGIVGQIKSWMSQTDTWSGTVLEHYQLQDVTTPTETKKEWVQVT